MVESGRECEVVDFRLRYLGNGKGIHALCRGIPSCHSVVRRKNSTVTTSTRFIRNHMSLDSI